MARPSGSTCAERARTCASISRVRPLVIGADDPPEVTGFGRADLHAAVATGVVQRVDPVVVTADDDDGVVVDVEDEIVAGAPHLTRVAGEEPAAAPDALEVELIDPGIGLELALECKARRVLGDEAVEQLLGFGELRRRQEEARHRLHIINGAIAGTAATRGVGPPRASPPRQQPPAPIRRAPHRRVSADSCGRSTSGGAMPASGDRTCETSAVGAC